MDRLPIDEQEILIRYGRLAPHARDRVLDQFYLIRPGGSSLERYVLVQGLTMALAAISLYLALLAVISVVIRFVAPNNCDQSYLLLGILTAEFAWVFWTIRQRYGKRYKEKIFQTTELGLSATCIKLHSRIIHGGFVTRSMSWRDLSSLTFIEGESQPHKPALGNRLELRDKSGRKLVLELDCIQTIEERRILRQFIVNNVTGLDTRSASENLLRVSNSADVPFTKLWSQALQDSRPRLNTAPLAPGRILQQGRFAIRSLIGGGGQGAVYLAGRHDLDEESEVALKEYVLPDLNHAVEHKAACEQFEKEVHLLGRLKHKGVIKLIDAFVEDHRAYLVLEHFSGISLRDYVERRGPLETSRVLNLARQMSDILAYLHAAKPAVMHLDFSPENILLGVNDQLTVIDFNISAEENSIRTRTVMGKQRYMAPEQYRGKPTPRSDIYALGATLFYLLTGLEPEPISVAKPNKHLPGIDAQVNNFVGRATALEEDKRFQNMAQVQAALEQIIATTGLVPGQKAEVLLVAGKTPGMPNQTEKDRPCLPIDKGPGPVSETRASVEPESSLAAREGSKLVATYKANPCPAELTLPYCFQGSARENLFLAWWQTRFLYWLFNMDSPAMMSAAIIVSANLFAALASAVVGGFLPDSHTLGFVATMPLSLAMGFFPVYAVLVHVNLKLGYGKGWLSTILGPSHIGLTDSGFKLWWRGRLFYNFPSLALWSDVYTVDLVTDSKYGGTSLLFIYQSGYGRKKILLPIEGFLGQADAALTLDYFARYVDEESQSPLFRQFGQIGFGKIARLAGLSQLTNLIAHPQQLEAIKTERVLLQTTADAIGQYIAPGRLDQTEGNLKS